MNNLLKSVFISFLPVIALIATVFSVLQLMENGFSWQYLGVFLTAFPNVVFFALVFLNKKPRTDANLKGYTPIIILGAILTLFGIYQEGFNSHPVILATILTVAWVLYLKWYSLFEDRTGNTVLKKGLSLPNFELENAQKDLVSSNSFKGNPSIYLFYRGNWCPLCMAQIKEIAEQYKELDKRGVNMVLVSPQSHKNTASLAKKFQVGFQFLVDKGNRVAKQLQILSENGLPFGFQALGYDSDTPLPTVIITDKNGKILFVDLTDNYRVRPEPATFLNILDGIGG